MTYVWNIRQGYLRYLTGEKYLRFPFGTEHEKMMESPIADLKNTGGDCCKTITGGLFLRHFTENIPWIHLDPYRR